MVLFYVGVPSIAHLVCYFVQSGRYVLLPLSLERNDRAYPIILRVDRKCILSALVLLHYGYGNFVSLARPLDYLPQLSEGVSAFIPLLPVRLESIHRLLLGIFTQDPTPCICLSIASNTFV